MMTYFISENHRINQLSKSIEEKHENISLELQELWIQLHQEICDKYELPAYHLTGDGFSLGDAEDEDAVEVFAKIHENEPEPIFTKSWIDDETDEWNHDELFWFLEDEFMKKYAEKAEELIEKYRMQIEEDELRELIEEQVKIAHDFEWSGWGIDICQNSDGEIWASEINSGQNYYPASEKICRVERWSVDEIEDDNEDREASIEYHTDIIVDDLIKTINEHKKFELV